MWPSNILQYCTVAYYSLYPVSSRTRSGLVPSLVSYPYSSCTRSRTRSCLVPGLVSYLVSSRTRSRLVPGLVSYPVSSRTRSRLCLFLLLAMVAISVGFWYSYYQEIQLSCLNTLILHLHIEDKLNRVIFFFDFTEKFHKRKHYLKLYFLLSLLAVSLT